MATKIVKCHNSTINITDNTKKYFFLVIYNIFFFSVAVMTHLTTFVI